jgi:hemerythrin-like domain-containing protein
MKPTSKQLEAENQRLRQLAAEALEAVERLEAEREQWQSIGAEEELRKVSDRINEKLDIENPQGFAERGLVASGYCEGLQECIDYIDEAVDEIKARRESAEATPGTAAAMRE